MFITRMRRQGVGSEALRRTEPHHRPERAFGLLRHGGIPLMGAYGGPVATPARPATSQGDSSRHTFGPRWVSIYLLPVWVTIKRIRARCRAAPAGRSRFTEG